MAAATTIRRETTSPETPLEINLRADDASAMRDVLAFELDKVDPQNTSRRRDLRNAIHALDDLIEASTGANRLGAVTLPGGYFREVLLDGIQRLLADVRSRPLASYCFSEREAMQSLVKVYATFNSRWPDDQHIVSLPIKKRHRAPLCEVFDEWVSGMRGDDELVDEVTRADACISSVQGGGQLIGDTAFLWRVIDPDHVLLDESLPTMAARAATLVQLAEIPD